MALLVLGTGVPEEPVPVTVAYKASSLTLALGEVARLFVEKPVGSCEVFLGGVCVRVYSDSTVVLFQSTYPWGRGVIFCRCTKVVMGMHGGCW